MSARRLRIRFDGRCDACQTELTRGTPAYWDRDGRRLECVTCGEPASVAGASARREHDRCRFQDEQSVRAAHPRLGGLLVAVRGERQWTRAWATDAEGEEAVGGMLDGLSEFGNVTLHDRRIPRSRANIDHVVVAPSGIYVVDTKHVRGRVEVRDVGGIFERDERLYVANRDRTRLTHALGKQADAVRRALGPTHVPVHAVLCFVGAEWRLLQRPFDLHATTVLWPRELSRRVLQLGRLDLDAVEVIARRLRCELPPN